jgi:hypothetical protein
MDIIVGSLLGDGTIKNCKANCSFSKCQCKRRKTYLDWHYEMLYPYSSSVDQRFSNEKLIGKNRLIERQKTEKYLSAYILRTHHHPVFTELRNKWYKDRTKIIPNDLTLNPQRIAIWFFDDGSNNVEQRHAILCTNCFTLEEADFLCQKFHEFNKVKSLYTGMQQPILKFSKSSYDNLIDIIRPYCLWDCFKYKTEWRAARKQWESSGKFTLEQIKEIKELRKTLTARQIAEMFKVHVNTIYAIVSGRSWKGLA